MGNKESFKVYKWFERCPNDDEKIDGPSLTDPSGYEPLEDFIRRSVSPEFIPDLIRKSSVGEGYTVDEVESKGDEILDTGVEIQDSSEFDISDVTENAFRLSKLGKLFQNSQSNKKVKKVEPEKSPVSKPQGTNEVSEEEAEETSEI